MERRVGSCEQLKRDDLVCRTYDASPFLQFGEFVARHVECDTQIFGQEFLRIIDEHGMNAVEAFVRADEEMIEVVDNPKIGDEHLILYYAALFYGRDKIEKDEFKHVYSLLHQEDNCPSDALDGLLRACEIINPLQRAEYADAAD